MIDTKLNTYYIAINMDDIELNGLINEFCNLDGIQAIVLGGSQISKHSDNKSDYDLYIYTEKIIDQNIRNKILSRYCEKLEIGNSYWELEDNGILIGGICFDIIYRNLQQFIKIIADVVENCNASNGFTTCLWHNILNSTIIYDKDDMFKNVKERFSVPFPEKLKENIIKRNMALLSDSLVSYDKQISKSVYRKDIININNRVSAFLASYYDIIFAINELPHPGEKRLMEICLNECKLLPNNFEINVNNILQNINSISEMDKSINNIINELKEII